MKRILPDTNIFGELVIDQDIDKIKEHLEKATEEIIIYGFRLIRDELRATPKPSRLEGKNLRVALLSLYDYFVKFGIGQKTGIDLQGEVAPKLREKGTWNVVDLATASFGQGVAVTGIEIVRAVSAIANGGYLVTPRVVTAVNGDGWEEKIEADPPTRIIKQQAAKEITQMMVEAAERGEAKWVKIPGFKVAGKTGTAQIPVAGHYDATNTIHSFVGFAPAGNPKFVMLVTLNSPQSSPWAAETAAPLWFAIAKDLFPYFGIQPEG